MQLDSHGIATTLPPGWEGRITRRDDVAFVPASPSTAGRSPLGGSGERMYPIAHLANFALPEDRGDFGSGAVELMGADHLFICLFEYGPEAVGTALFQAQGLPRHLAPEQFNPRALQRTIPGQGGVQLFFTEGGRAFCLFIALGAHGNARALVAQANQVLATMKIEPR